MAVNPALATFSTTDWQRNVAVKDVDIKAKGAQGEESAKALVVSLEPSSAAVPTAQPVGGAYTDRSIANLSGASEQLMAANANRRVLAVFNIGASAVGVNLTGGAASLTVGGSVNIPAGGSLILNNYPPTGIITIIGTLNADVTAYEG